MTLHGSRACRNTHRNRDNHASAVAGETEYIRALTKRGGTEDRCLSVSIVPMLERRRSECIHPDFAAR